MRRRTKLPFPVRPRRRPADRFVLACKLCDGSGYRYVPSPEWPYSDDIPKVSKIVVRCKCNPGRQ